ncbi:type II secretion system protein GspM [Desulforamulus ferrireducens]|uniref:Uncharacterized protein n=1 Tax=Desulforamulus ferrireducens TaxID=1833852 RepID=A0A1S6IUP1_9FIRM|nr:type II secretion system protein GspM [Desulforamulus ferrireducens]AQS58483.1 hypothetical protein B0537_04915 [Desulforamulus ferrireducens]
MLQNLSKREKIMLSVLVVVVLVFVFVQCILTPQLVAFEEMRITYQEQTQQLQQAKGLAKETNQNELLHESARKLKQLAGQFQAEVSDGSGLVKLAIESLNENIELIGFQPLPKQDKTYYYEVPFRMVLRGNFVDVLNYFKNLEQQKILPNPVEIRELKITQPKLQEREKQNDIEGMGLVNIEAKPNLASGMVEASFVLMTYASHDPQSLLALEEISKWVVGRENPFRHPGKVSPYPGVKPAEETVLFPSLFHMKETATHFIFPKALSFR